MTEAGFTQRIPYLVHFDGSVRGLRAGAPVEFRGIRVGTVTDVRLEIDPAQDTVRIPVTLEIEPQRFGVERAPKEPYAVMAALIERGLQAQLSSLATCDRGALVDLDFHPESPPAKLDRSGTCPEIPAIPAQLEALEASVTAVLSKLAALPLPDLVADLRRTIQSVDALVSSPDTGQAVAAPTQAAVRLDGLIGTLDQRPGRCSSRRSRRSLRRTGWSGRIAGASRPERPAQGADGAARSIRVFADYLERHPDALIRGKTGVQ